MVAEDEKETNLKSFNSLSNPNYWRTPIIILKTYEQLSYRKTGNMTIDLSAYGNNTICNSEPVMFLCCYPQFFSRLYKFTTKFY